MQPSAARSSRATPVMRSWESRAIVFSSAKIPALIPSLRRSRIVVAPQVQPAIGAQDLDEFPEDDPVAYPRLVAAQRVPGVIAGPQRGELVPEGLQKP
jgi:hypothetical protein